MKKTNWNWKFKKNYKFDYKRAQSQNCMLTSMPENALSGRRRMELCEKSKLRSGKFVVAYAYKTIINALNNKE